MHNSGGALTSKYSNFYKKERNCFYYLKVYNIERLINSINKNEVILTSLFKISIFMLFLAEKFTLKVK